MNPRAGAKEFRNIRACRHGVVTRLFVENRTTDGPPPALASKIIGFSGAVRESAEVVRINSNSKNNNERH
jgi:hypothetical protein